MLTDTWFIFFAQNELNALNETCMTFSPFVSSSSKFIQGFFYEEKDCSICSKFWRDKICMSFIYSVYFSIYINLKYRINLILFSKTDVFSKHSCIFWCIKNMMKVYASLWWLILITTYNSSHKNIFGNIRKVHAL